MTATIVELPGGPPAMPERDEALVRRILREVRSKGLTSVVIVGWGPPDKAHPKEGPVLYAASTRDVDAALGLLARASHFLAVDGEAGEPGAGPWEVWDLE